MPVEERRELVPAADILAKHAPHQGKRIKTL